MADQTTEIRFGGQDADYLLLSVRGRAYRQSREYWDGNWLLVTATIHVGKFSGEVPGMLRAEELLDFHTQFQTFYQSLNGVVTFKTMEDWLTLQIDTDKTGHIRIIGKLSDNIVFPANVLTFSLATDQTFLTSPLKQLQTVTQAFPVVGKHA